MSKVISSLLCDFIVPVVGGSIFAALSTIVTLCGEMKENEAVCRRVYERLHFVCDELQKFTNVSLRESRVLDQYSSTIARFLEFMQSHSRKRLLRRLVESSRVVEQVQEFHEEIDELFKLLSIVHMTEMSAWRQEWERDRNLQRIMLQEALSEVRFVHNADSPCNSLATITTSVCSSYGSMSDNEDDDSLQPTADFLDTEQRLVVREKELEETIRNHVGEYGYDVCGVLDLLRSLPSNYLALRGAAVLHDLEIELQPEVLCLALPHFTQEIIHTSEYKQDKKFSLVREIAQQYWCEWFPANVQALVEGRGVLFENNATSELLGAAGNEFKVDSEWRPIVTSSRTGGESKPTDDDLEIQWKLVPEDDSKTLFRVVNFRYPYEWLYATTVRCQCIQGATYALTSQSGLTQNDSTICGAPGALWELQPVPPTGGGHFALFNSHAGGFLCTADARLSPHQRSALIIPKNDAIVCDGSIERRCIWNLRECSNQNDKYGELLGGRSSQDKQEVKIRSIPEAAREIVALELVIRNVFELSGRDIGAVLGFLQNLPEAKHILFGLSIARSLDQNAAQHSSTRRNGLVLPFFVHELAAKLSVDSRPLLQQYWLYWFSPVVKAIVLGRGLLLETEANDGIEFLISPKDKLDFDDTQRPVTTRSGKGTRIGIRRHDCERVPSTDDLEAQWHFVPVDATRTLFRIVNYRYPYEAVRATGKPFKFGDSPCTNTHVVTTRWNRAPKSPVQLGDFNDSENVLTALWELHDEGEDTYAFFHPQQKGYLCPTIEKLNTHHRFVSLCTDIAEQRCRWRFRCPLGLGLE